MNDEVGGITLADCKTCCIATVINTVFDSTMDIEIKRAEQRTPKQTYQPRGQGVYCVVTWHQGSSQKQDLWVSSRCPTPAFLLPQCCVSRVGEMISECGWLLGEQGCVTIVDNNNLQRCSCGLHRERVEAVKSCPEDPVSGRNAGDIQPFGVAR